ncbi:hypothetical protein CLHOM_26680 [Clostridium homopropionicum DSM 5847]|uniref:Putative component of 'biosynthetic module' domain-containing protein n=1 Tax=Clostridium homopropionicum DSM 5847 TaxID=1121318 RepID=A0A0L6Z801_9CLOT|nr:YceG family protein [Clostridium homopropionicum]KOA18928.1 hypothetical protein CLHOM_26680 [Clostridium homopropionicum DSM 5847]SFG44246.1 Putative component of 'biosynthetic module' [Clostridium homopropionicum]
MISVRKHINSSLKTSNNVFQDIFTPINQRLGFINGPSPIVPIYFYRFVGMGNNEASYYEELRNLDENLLYFNNLYFKFISEIPLDNDPSLVDKIQFVWNRSHLDPFDNSKIEILISLLAGNGCFPLANNSLLSSSIEESFSNTLSLYIKKEPNVNLTKVKNFTLKLVNWINVFLPKLLKDFNLKVENGVDIINPKILYLGDIKKHEVYFLIFLSRIGCDVLYINSPNDGDFSIIDKECCYSNCKVAGTGVLGNLNIDKLNLRCLNLRCLPPEKSEKSEKSQKDFSSPLVLENAIKSIYKTSNDILKDFILPLNKRSGFVGKPMPLIPVYFYRYIGIKASEEEYYNDLYKLNLQLQKYGPLYLKFTNDIPVETNAELIIKTSEIWRTVPEKPAKNAIVNMLIDCKVFPDLREEIINSSIINSFSKILELYIAKELGVNNSKIKNFTLKILIWLYKYIPNLFKKFDYLKNSNDEIFNPKILYYGDIKKHEAYFLIFLSLMGCDILYINSKEDKIFEEIDKEETFSRLLSLPQVSELKEFPSEEIIVRHETAAFKAHREIGDILYDENDGIYRPWQFEAYKTHPLTLKTTYDELKLLWKEEARMRPGFKVEAGTVYIPNLFAKISGTFNDLNQYWNDFKDFKNVEDLLFISDIPYILDNNYSRYDLYSLEYCFKNGMVDKESLLSNRLYKFSYLKTPLQNGIIDKINQLLKLSIFKNKMETEFKLKILMTVLSLNENILKLIQKFDYPFKIPKILIYDNDKDIFSDSDSIVVAFLSLMGFDIAIFTPTGYNNIEQKIQDTYYDTHKLENVNFDLQIPNLNSIRKNKEKSGSFWSNLFK